LIADDHFISCSHLAHSCGAISRKPDTDPTTARLPCLRASSSSGLVVLQPAATRLRAAHIDFTFGKPGVTRSPFHIHHAGRAGSSKACHTNEQTDRKRCTTLSVQRRPCCLPGYHARLMTDIDAPTSN